MLLSATQVEAGRPVNLFPNDGTFAFDFPPHDVMNRGYRFTAVSDIDVEAIELQKNTFQTCEGRIYDAAGIQLATGSIASGSGFLTWMRSEFANGIRLHAGQIYTISMVCTDTFHFEMGIYNGGDDKYDIAGYATSVQPVYDSLDIWPTIADEGRSPALRIAVRKSALMAETNTQDLAVTYDGPRGVIATAVRDMHIASLELWAAIPLGTTCSFHIWDAASGQRLRTSDVAGLGVSFMWYRAATSLQITADASYILSYSCNGPMEYWQWQTNGGSYLLTGDFWNVYGRSGESSDSAPTVINSFQPVMRVSEDLELRSPSASGTTQVSAATDTTWAYEFTVTWPVTLHYVDANLTATEDAAMTAHVFDTATQQIIATSPSIIGNDATARWYRWSFGDISLELDKSYAIGVHTSGGNITIPSPNGAAPYDVPPLLSNISGKHNSGGTGYPDVVSTHPWLVRLGITGEPTFCDNDSDGAPRSLCGGTDCDDDDSGQHPIQTEVTGSGIDEDCDGISVCWSDADHDKARSDTDTVDSIINEDCDDDGEALSLAAIDCDDTDDRRHPEATEVADNLDNDCDNIIDNDADGDGLTDDEEAILGSNANAADSDGDGLSDFAEAGPPIDTDGDGIIDALDTDDDNDGIPTADELPSGEPTDSDQDGTPDHQDVDSDDDGVRDGDEGSGDVDCDGIPDRIDTNDSDHTCTDAGPVPEPKQQANDGCATSPSLLKTPWLFVMLVVFGVWRSRRSNSAHDPPYTGEK